MRLRLTVNENGHEIDVPPGVTLLEVLRDDLGLTGTRYGCGHGVCGACVVLIAGVATPSCRVTVAEVAARPIVTIEGLAQRGTLHPVQQAFVDEDAMQCGYCTSGMIMTAVALLAETPRPTDDHIRELMAPHLCRCGVYGRVLRAVKRAGR